MNISVLFNGNYFYAYAFLCFIVGLCLFLLFFFPFLTVVAWYTLTNICKITKSSIKIEF